jgi:hypothetical protein
MDEQKHNDNTWMNKHTMMGNEMTTSQTKGRRGLPIPMDG